MSATAERAADRLMRAGGRAELVKEMLTATFDVICDVALSGREHFDSDTFSRAITQYFQTAGRASMLDFLGFPEWFPRPGELLAGSSVRTMHSMVATAIDARRREKHGAEKADDLLDRMLAAEDPETGHRMSPQDLIHNMQFFIVAGHETTALALVLGALPARQFTGASGARAGAGDAPGFRGRVAEAADLPHMPFIRAGAGGIHAALSASGTVGAKRAGGRRALRPRHAPQRHPLSADLGAASP